MGGAGAPNATLAMPMRDDISVIFALTSFNFWTSYGRTVTLEFAIKRKTVGYTLGYWPMYDVHC